MTCDVSPVAMFYEKDDWVNYAKGLISYHGNNHDDVAGCATYCLNVFFRKISARRAYWEEVPTMHGSSLRVFFRTADITRREAPQRLMTLGDTYFAPMCKPPLQSQLVVMSICSRGSLQQQHGQLTSSWVTSSQEEFSQNFSSFHFSATFSMKEGSLHYIILAFHSSCPPCPWYLIWILLLPLIFATAKAVSYGHIWSRGSS